MRLIKIKEVMEKTSLARATVYKYVKEGTFPQAISIGANRVAWLEEEVDNWILRLLEKRKNSQSS